MYLIEIAYDSIRPRTHGEYTISVLPAISRGAGGKDEGGLESWVEEHGGEGFVAVFEDDGVVLGFGCWGVAYYLGGGEGEVVWGWEQVRRESECSWPWLRWIEGDNGGW